MYIHTYTYNNTQYSILWVITQGSGLPLSPPAWRERPGRAGEGRGGRGYNVI